MIYLRVFVLKEFEALFWLLSAVVFWNHNFILLAQLAKLHTLIWNDVCVTATEMSWFSLKCFMFIAILKSYLYSADCVLE